MQGTAIPSEFNPFHNGHKYIINQIRKTTGAPFVGAVMSGSFVQRGEPALYDKFTRTKAALMCGADIVLELPVPYATGGADVFAYGCVSTISQSGIFSHIAFGTESSDPAPLNKAAQALAEEPASFQSALREYLSKGLSYPSARAAALCQTSQIAPEILNTPNNILAIEYIKAIILQSSGITPIPVKRIVSSYSSADFTGEISSAAAIRKAILQNKTGALKVAVPQEALPLYENPLATLPSMEIFAEALRCIIFSHTAEELSRISDVTEGLENKIIQNSDFKSISDLLARLKSKRYTLSKLRRCILHILLNIQKSQILPPKPVPYIRVLGVRRSKLSLLSALKANSEVPVIINTKKDLPSLSPQGRKLFEQETFASNLYFRKRSLDYTHGIIIQ